MTKKDEMAKATFWYRMSKTSHLDPDKLEIGEIARLSGNSEIEVKLNDPEYHTWFMDTGTDMILLSSATKSAVEELIHIMEGEEVRPATRLAAAKLVLELNGYTKPSESKSDFKDSKIGEMTEEELEAYIAKRAPKLTVVEGESNG